MTRAAFPFPSKAHATNLPAHPQDHVGFKMANITSNEGLGALTNLSPLDSFLIEDLPKYYISGLSIAAAITALVWDTLLTFDEERKYIWNSSWQAIKYLFLVVRYLAISVQGISGLFLFTNVTFSDEVCSTYKFIGAFGISALIGSTDMLLIYRVFAFCGRNKHLLYFLIALYICTHATTCTLLFVFAPDYQEIANPFPQLRPVLVDCPVVSYSQTLTFVWPIMLIFQSILFSCVLFRVIYTRYGAWNLGIPVSPLYIVFVRDGLWAYAAIVLNLMLCVIYSHNHSVFGPALILWLITTSSVCGCRLILNLRGSYHQASSASSTEALAMQTRERLTIRFRVPTGHGQETTFA